MWRGEIENSINQFNINNKLKLNGEIIKYIEDYYNWGKPYRNIEKYEYDFFIFKEDAVNKPMSRLLYNILARIANQN